MRLMLLLDFSYISPDCIYDAQILKNIDYTMKNKFMLNNIYIYYKLINHLPPKYIVYFHTNNIVLKMPICLRYERID